jgi:hypothetical protein
MREAKGGEAAGVVAGEGPTGAAGAGSARGVGTGPLGVEPARGAGPLAVGPAREAGPLGFGPAQEAGVEAGLGGGLAEADGWVCRRGGVRVLPGRGLCRPSPTGRCNSL